MLKVTLPAAYEDRQPVKDLVERLMGKDPSERFHGQFGQLPQSGNPTDVNFEEDEELQGSDVSDRCWKDEDDNVWMTNFAPPPGFEGWEKCKWGGWRYERECTPEEAAVLEANRAAAEAAEREEEDQLRDAWFAMLGEGLDTDRPPESNPA